MPSVDPPVRKKQKTLPPPPPGSVARATLEQQILDSSTTPRPIRSNPPTQPPPPPAASRLKAATMPPPTPVHRPRSTQPPPMPSPTPSPPPIPSIPSMPPMPPVPRTKPPTVNVPVIASTLAPKLDTTVVDPPRPAPALLPDRAETDVPRGEFEHASTSIDPAHPETTVRPQPIEVLLAETATHLARGDTGEASGTTPFERGDPTTNDNASQRVAIAQTSPNSRLRNAATLRRKRGIGGDVRYVFTVVFGVRRAKTELAELEQKQEIRRLSRRRHLITLGRTAAVTDGLAHPALVKARDQLGDVEEERAQHTGAVAAADQELARVKRDRETKLKAFAGNVTALTAELAELAKKQEPLDREVGAIKKRAAELRDSLGRVDAKITAAQSSLVSVRGTKLDPAAIHAEIATLKADRRAIERDEPVIAGELDVLNPRLAQIDSQRSEAQRRLVEIETNEKADQRRTEELLDAIGAKRKVVDRASVDSEVLRDKILFELGERLNVDRPKDLATLLSPIDEIDMDLGEADRRLMELREIIGSVDGWKLFRGWAVILLVLAALGAFTTWLVYQLL